MTEPLIRPFAAADTEALVALSLRAWEPVFASIAAVLGPDLYARTYPDWRSQQSDVVRTAVEANETWVSLTESTITGFVNVIFDTDEESGEIYLIAVDPPHQGRRFASALTEFALDEMRRRGMTMATVSTGGDPGHTAARKTYERAGFTAFPQVYYSRLL